MAKSHSGRESGPFTADQLKDGDRYELSDGHPVYCLPAGRPHAAGTLSGGSVLETDPAVEWGGVDAGFTPEPGTLRAPDLAVAAPGDEQGWIPGVPPLAVDYAAPGQEEADLKTKVAELLAAGTRLVCVVRLIGPRRVEVHTPDRPVRSAGGEESLEAPGILQNPVPVAALFDRDVAHEATLRNLLQRRGYESLDAVRAESASRTLAESVIALLQSRGLPPDHAQRERIFACTDPGLLKQWLLKAARMGSVEEVLDSGN